MALGDEHYEEPSEIPDGVIQNYTTSVAYQAGTLRVWINGVLIAKGGDDGWTETGAAAFQTKEVLRAGDTVHVRYLEA